MVKSKKKSKQNVPKKQGPEADQSKAIKIGPNTNFDTCQERLSPFGGILALLKFLDLFRFQEIFENFYLPPSRKPKLGHYKMVLSILML